MKSKTLTALITASLLFGNSCRKSSSIEEPQVPEGAIRCYYNPNKKVNYETKEFKDNKLLISLPVDKNSSIIVHGYIAEGREKYKISSDSTSFSDVFPVSDEPSMKTIEEMLKQQGYQGQIEFWQRNNSNSQSYNP